MTSIDKPHSSRDVFLLQVRSFPDSNAKIFIVSVNTPTKSQNSTAARVLYFCGLFGVKSSWVIDPKHVCLFQYL